MNQPSAPPASSDDECISNDHGSHENDCHVLAEEGIQRQDQGDDDDVEDEEIIDIDPDPVIIVDGHGVPFLPPMPPCKSDGTSTNESFSIPSVEQILAPDDKGLISSLVAPDLSHVDRTATDTDAAFSI